MGLREEIAAWAAAEEAYLDGEGLREVASAIGRLAWKIDPHGRPGAVRDSVPPARAEHPAESAEAVSTARMYVATAGQCPDGGTCHHGCWERRPLGPGFVDQRGRPCFRVLTCGPLSGKFPGDYWPPEVLAAEREADRREFERSGHRVLPERTEILLATADARDAESMRAARAALEAAAVTLESGSDLHIEVIVNRIQVTQDISSGIHGPLIVTRLP